MDMSIPTDMERSTGMERSMGINTIMQRKSQLLMCTVTDTDMLAIRMDTRKHMTMVIVMVGMRIITVMQKKSQLLMFIVTDMVTHMDMVSCPVRVQSCAVSAVLNIGALQDDKAPVILLVGRILCRGDAHAVALHHGSVAPQRHELSSTSFDIPKCIKYLAVTKLILQ